MHFSKLTTLLTLAAATAVQAVNVLVEVNGNAISAPTAGDIVEAGAPVEIVWNPTTEGDVTLVLRKGDSNALDTLETIAEDIENTGTYTWTPSDELVASDDYAIEIRWGAADDFESNYSPKFVVDSDVVEVTTTATATATTTATSTGESTTVTETATETETETGTSTFVTSTSTRAASNTTAGSKPTDDSEIPVEGAAGKMGVSVLAVVAAAVAFLA